MTQELSYQNYDDKSLLVHGNRSKYQKQINLIGGRWNSKQDGWILPLNNKNKLLNIINSTELSSGEHKKYKREDTYDYSTEESENDDDKNDIIVNKLETEGEADKDENELILNRLLSKHKQEKVIPECSDESGSDTYEVSKKIVTQQRHDKTTSFNIDDNSDDDKKARNRDFEIRRKEEEIHNSHKNRRDNSDSDNESELRLKYNKNRELDERRREEEKRMIDYKRREDENRLRELKRIAELKRRDEENNAKRKYGKQDPMLYNKTFRGDEREDNPYSYYKSFNKKPVDFRKIHKYDSGSESDDIEESSSDYSESSSDGFPSPGSPRKRDDYRKHDYKNYDDLYSKVQDIQRRLSDMEIQNKRRR